MRVQRTVPTPPPSLALLTRWLLFIDLRFVCSSPEHSLSVTGPPTEKWALVDVAHNNTRGSSQRLREKREKIRQATHRPSSESDRVRALEQQLRAAEQRAQDAEQRAAEELHLRVDAERRVQELVAENGRLQRSERRAQLAEQQLEDTVRQKQDIERELEGKTKELAAHNTEVWRIPSSKVVTMTTIGTGGWGEVLEGTVRVAVKRLHIAILNQRNLERLQREMRLLAEVRHPNLVQFIGAVFDRSPPLIVTELLDMNLRQAYEQNRLGPGDRLSIFIDVAKALDYLHQRYEPIIHRDVSAPNVLLQRMPNNQWKGKVSDLGSANFLQNAQTMGEGAIVYSPPEVIPRAYNPRREQVRQTTKIDVYSYGVLLCEVTTSRFPSAENYWDMVESVRRDCPQLHALIEHCTQERPDDRPTMETVLVRLNRHDMPRV